jgi:hypothetical protein
MFILVAVFGVVLVTSGIFYGCKKEDIKPSNNSETFIQKDRSCFSGYYKAVSIATQNLLLSNINIGSTSEQDFIKLYSDFITRELNNQNAPIISYYPSFSSYEVHLFEILISIYFDNTISSQDRISKIDNYMQTIENDPSIAMPIKERLFALEEMLKASGIVDLSKLHKLEGDSQFERRLSAALNDELKAIQDNPIRMAVFILGLPESFFGVLGSATYRVLRGDYNDIK